MQEFDINKIKMVDRKKENPEVPIEKLLTGEYIQGLKENSGIVPNAELEGDEYLQFPEGGIQKVVGNSHEKGGADMAIPDGTKIISKTLTLKADQAKRLKKIFDIDVTTKTSYAQAIDKYSAKIGLKKLNEEQEDLFNKMKSMLDKKIPEETLRVNKEYLSKKIFDIEQKKKEKEAMRAEFFDRVFDMQETAKPKGDSNPNYKNGGVSMEGFKKVAAKYGLSEEDAMALVNTGSIPRYPDGGVKFGVFKVENQFKDSDIYPVEKQAANESNYGVPKSNDDIIKEYYRNFPDILLQDDVLGQYIDKDSLKSGEVKWKKKLPLNKETQEIYNFQLRAGKQMKSSAQDIIKNPKHFSEEALKFAQEYLKNETFTDEVKNLPKNASTQDKVRALDKKLGNFTAGRYALGMDVVTPREWEDLSKQGIYTVNQITDEVLETLDPTTQERIAVVRSFKGKDSDYALGQYTLNGKPAPQKAPPVEEPNQDFTDYAADYKATPKGPRMFYMPDQSSLPPSSLEAQLKVENRFGRIDPIKIGIDQNIQQIADSRQFVQSQLEGLPDSQRAAALAGLLATSQTATNQAATQTNVINAQNQSQAELFNIGQADRENIAAGQNALNYEQRALRGRALAEEELRNWFDRNQTVALNNFKNQQQLNLLNSMFPDYQLNFMGTGVDYAPSYNYELNTKRGPEDRADYLAAMRALKTTP